MTKNISTINVAASTFQNLYDKLNEVVTFVQTETVTANSTGGITSGNGYVNGTFGSLSFYANTMRGGNTTTSANLTILSGLNVSNNVVISGNLTVNGQLLFGNSTSLTIPAANGTAFGNTTKRWLIYSTDINSSGNTSLNIVTVSGTITIGNSTVNSVINSTSFSGISLSANNATNFNGQPASFYANASNITTGTLAAGRLPSANLTTQGAVRLIDSISNTSVSGAATPNSVKAAYDAAIAANNLAAGKQSALGFTPVQQGGGNNQISTKLYIGVDANNVLRAQANTSDLGIIWTDISSPKSFASNGYQKLPSGLIIQWGVYTGGVTDPTITFPISFNSIVYSLCGAINDVGDGYRLLTLMPTNVLITSFVGRQRNITSFGSVSTSTSSFYWFAIGV